MVTPTHDADRGAPGAGGQLRPVVATRRSPARLNVLARLRGGDSTLVTLMCASTIVATVAAVIDLWRMEVAFGIVRLRQLPLFWLTRRLLEQFDISLVAQSPRIVNTPFDLSVQIDFWRFAWLALGLEFVLMWVLALPAVALLLAFGYARTRWFRSAAHGWANEAAFPVAALAAFALPAILVGVRDLEPRNSYWLVVGLAVAIAGAGWAMLTFLLRRPRQARRALAVGTVASALIAGVLIGVGAVASAVGRVEQFEQPPAAAGKPNVLLVSIDSLRADHVHSYGYPRETTPTLDRLAREGALFRNAFSPTSWTLPAHLTLLSALPPEEHGVVDDGRRLGGDVVLLSQALWQAGYHTGGFVSAPYLDASYGYARGFDLYDDYSIGIVSDRAAAHGITGPTIAAAADTWLRDWSADGRGRPFFMFLHLWDVHYDYTPPAPFDRMFDPDYAGTITGQDFMQNPRVNPHMDRRDLDHVIALYDGEIRFTDDVLGQVVSRLEQLGVLEDTIVVVTADHGDEFFEHGRKGHQQTLYDESTHVPLIMRFPTTIRAGTEVSSTVRLMDVAPTILALAGVSAPPGFGTSEPRPPQAERSLLPWLAGREADGLTVFGDLEVRDAPRPLASIRTPDGMKLIDDLSDANRDELYDLATDAGERSNLIGEAPQRSTALHGNLAAWRQRWTNGVAQSKPFELSDGQRERLRQLGYLK